MDTHDHLKWPREEFMMKFDKEVNVMGFFERIREECWRKAFEKMTIAKWAKREEAEMRFAKLLGLTAADTDEFLNYLKEQGNLTELLFECPIGSTYRTILREKMADHVDQTKEMEKSSKFTHDPKERKESLPYFMKSPIPAIVESFNSPMLSGGLVGRTAAEAGESSTSRDGLVRKPCEEFGNSAGFVDPWPIDSTPRSKDVCIDIPPHEIEYGQWTDYIDSQKARADKSWPMDIETTNAIGRAEAAATALRSGFSGLSYAAAGAKIFSNTAVLGGLAFELAGIGLRDVKPKLALVMAKTGAILAASAVIVSLAMAIPPALAWPFGTAATLLVAYSVAKS